MQKFFKRLFRMSAVRLAFVITVVVIAADFTEPEFLQIIEVKALDAKFKTRGVVRGNERVAIIAIDEKSLQELGRWPWPRWTMAKLVDRLRDAGAAAVGFDIVFAEPDQNSELKKVRELRQLFREYGLDRSPDFSDLPVEYAYAATDRARTYTRGAGQFYRELVESEARANSDETLAASIAAFADNTVLGYFFYGSSGRGEMAARQVTEAASLIADSRIKVILGDNEPVYMADMAGVVPNIAPISMQTPHAGHFYMTPDAEDGTIRWNHLVLRFQDGYYPSLGLKTASVALDKPIIVKREHGNIVEVRLGDIRIPTDETGRLLINFAGPMTDDDGNLVTYDVFSFADIMQGRIPPEELKDRIFLVGPTAIGIYDMRNTPFSAVYPGVGVHANVIGNILDQSFIRKPAWMKLFDLGIIVSLGLVLGLVLGRLKSLPGAFAALFLAFGYYFFTQVAFERWGIWLSTVYPILEIVAVFGIILTYKYFTEERQARQIRGAFQSYVTPSVVESVLREPERLKLGGETRELTVMFSDVRGFTTISEKLTSEQLVELLNNYLSKMTDLVFESDGTLDKYIGDALMAIWGAPVVQDDHAVRACYTAIDMLEVLEKELKPRWIKDGLKTIPAGTIPAIDIGIGLNTGSMTVGNMGSDQRFDYTVMGDNVNLASRLEGTTKQYANNIIISEFTRRVAGDAIVVRELDSVRVKGKLEPVRIFDLIGKKGQVEDRVLEKVALFEQGLALYRKTEWDMAEKVWQKLLIHNPDDETTRIFLKRIEEFRRNPVPQGWDGVYEMKTK